jgi:hypothetical protein
MHSNQRKRVLRIETFEKREVFAASMGWDGPGQGTAQLTYYIEAVPSTFSLSASQVQSAIDSALRVWASAASVGAGVLSKRRQHRPPCRGRSVRRCGQL